MVSYSLNPLPQKLGKRLGANFPKVQKMLREGPETEVMTWATLLLEGKPIQLGLNGQTVEVTPEEVEVRQRIEREAAGIPRRLVAEVICRDAVHHLMHDCGENNDDDEKNPIGEWHRATIANVVCEGCASMILSADYGERM